MTEVMPFGARQFKILRKRNFDDLEIKNLTWKLKNRE